MKVTVLSALLSLFFLTVASQEHYMVIGTYDSPKSEGIHILTFNTQTGDTKPVSLIKTSNPSYLAVSADKKFVYAVNETKPGSVASFSFDPGTGNLSLLNQRSSGGDYPCYLALDKSGKWLTVGNYGSGTVTLLPVKNDGRLDYAYDVMKHISIVSPDGKSQLEPHVHCTVFSPDNRYLYVTDLGIDQVITYALDGVNGRLNVIPPPYFVNTVAGAGPRHFVFHPNGKFTYVIEELKGAISVYSAAKLPYLELVQNISTHPVGYKGAIASADIHVSPDGKFLYASNRGESNTLAIFKIDPATGTLTLLGHQSTLGNKPRNFNFDPTGNFLLVANQDSDEIVIFKRDLNTGLLTDTGKRVSIGKPVCIEWLSPVK